MKALVVAVVGVVVLTTGEVIDDSSLLGPGGETISSSSSLESTNLELTNAGLPAVVPCSVLPLLNRDKNPLLLEIPGMSSLLELSLLRNLAVSFPVVVVVCLGDRRVFAKVLSPLGFMRLKLESEGTLSKRGRDMSPLAMSMGGEPVVLAVDVAVGVWRKDMRIGLRSLAGEVVVGGGTEEARFAEVAATGAVVREVVTTTTDAGRELRRVLAAVGLIGGTEEVRRVLGTPFCFCWRRGDSGTEDVKGVERGIVIPGGLDGWICCAGGCVVFNFVGTAVGVVVAATGTASDVITGTT